MSTMKKDWVQTWIQKLIQATQTEENKKLLQILLIDPILNHILERLFPYVFGLCMLFILLTIMIFITLLIVFTRLPSPFNTYALPNTIGSLS